MRKTAAWILVSFFYITAFAQTKEGIKVTDLLQVKSINSVALSPDGSKALYALTSIELNDNAKWDYKYTTQLWIAPTDGNGEAYPITTAKEGASQGSFSPNGKDIVFVRAVNGRPQLFLLSLSGGEPKQLTNFKYGASNPRWNADGTALLFTASINLKEFIRDPQLNPNKEVPSWNSEKPGFTNNSNLVPNTAKPDPNGSMEEVRAYLELNETDRMAKVINKLNFQEESTTSGESSISHVFLLNLKKGGNPVPVTKGFYSFSNPQFIPGTNSILVDADYNTEVSPDRTQESQIMKVDLSTGAATLFLGKKDMSYNGSVVSPDGKFIAFQYGNTGFASVPALGIIAVDGSPESVLTIPFDRNKNSVIWGPDNNTLYFTASSNGGITLNKLEIPTRKITTLTDVNSGINAIAIKNGVAVYSKTQVTNPFELYVSTGDFKTDKALTHHNSDWIANKQLSIPEKHSFVNEKGLTVEYWVMKPTNYEPGKKYPLLLEIHGGPSAMWGPGENSMWHEFQFWCSKGYGVVYSNPRGSGGYGVNFLRANVNDWGNGPMRDVLTSLDKTVAEGWADTSKLAVTGGSYAGYLVAYIIGHDKRFKAACSQRGVYDLRTFFGEGNAWRLVPNYFGGYPWEKNVLPILERESPINYVQNITTPYIIFHGENDLRTGVIQGEQLYKSLKVLGRPVEYVRHPGATHEITRSGVNRQRIDQMLRTWEFFARYIN